MFLEEDEQDELLEQEEEGFDETEEEEEGYLEGEETLEELDVDAYGHVRPRRSRRDEEDYDPEY